MRLLRHDARDAWDMYRAAPILFWSWLLAWHAATLALFLLTAAVASAGGQQSRFQPLEDAPLVTTATMMAVFLYKALTSRTKASAASSQEGKEAGDSRGAPVASDAAMVLAFASFAAAGSLEILFFTLEPWNTPLRWTLSLAVSAAVSVVGGLHWGQDQDIRAKALALQAAREEDAEAARIKKIDEDSRKPPEANP